VELGYKKNFQPQPGTPNDDLQLRFKTTMPVSF
jgi:hypothetical protein